jgi:hypothetical protein
LDAESNKNRLLPAFAAASEKWHVPCSIALQGSEKL